jgi:hypothetical protein
MFIAVSSLHYSAQALAALCYVLTRFAMHVWFIANRGDLLPIGRWSSKEMHGFADRAGGAPARTAAWRAGDGWPAVLPTWVLPAAGPLGAAFGWGPYLCDELSQTNHSLSPHVVWVACVVACYPHPSADALPRTPAIACHDSPRAGTRPRARGRGARTRFFRRPPPRLKWVLFSFLRAEPEKNFGLAASGSPFLHWEFHTVGTGMLLHSPRRRGASAKGRPTHPAVNDNLRDWVSWPERGFSIA